jgi:hypothetical protein
MLARIVDARLEIVAVVNAITVVVAQFGLSVSEEQQLAITGVVNALLILGYRLVRGAPAAA